MTLGKNTSAGFQSLTPSMEDVMKRIGMMGDRTAGFAAQEAVPVEKSESAKEREELLKAYVRFSNTDDGKRILEDLLNITLRSGFVEPGAQSIEQVALYTSKRAGQNGIMIYIAKMIVDGIAMAKKPASKAKGKK